MRAQHHPKSKKLNHQAVSPLKVLGGAGWLFFATRPGLVYGIPVVVCGVYFPSTRRHRRAVLRQLSARRPPCVACFGCSSRSILATLCAVAPTHGGNSARVLSCGWRRTTTAARLFVLFFSKMMRSMPTKRCLLFVRSFFLFVLENRVEMHDRIYTKNISVRTNHIKIKSKLLLN